jgi:hypothetical protein
VQTAAATVVIAALALLGCGGGGDPPPLGAARATDAAAVIDAWSDAMRRSDIEAATDRFALPAVVSNGTPEIELQNRSAVYLFNKSLPCGSVLVDTEEHHGLTIATFELTDRPGSDCGSGTGAQAKVAFDVREGLIAGWIRVRENVEPADPDGPVT